MSGRALLLVIEWPIKILTVLFHSKNDSYCDKSTPKFDHKNILTTKSIGKFEG